MSRDKHKAEAAAKALLQTFVGFRRLPLTYFLVNREGWPNANRKEVRWLLYNRYVRRERRAFPSSICPARRFTCMVLTPKGKKLMEAP